jgi:hypothetical protein
MATGFVRFLLSELETDQRTQAEANLRSTIDEHLGAEGVSMASAAWLITATRGA